MAMDFVAARHHKKLFKARAMFSLEEHAHAQLLQLATPAKDFPALHKIDDYYADATILFSELQQFRNELRTLIDASKDARTFLDLLHFIDQALRDENNVYVTAD